MSVGQVGQKSILPRLRAAVRQGSDPDNPALLYYWFEFERVAILEASSECLREKCRHQFRLLIDTYSDLLVPRQWRILCLDNIYRPFEELRLLVRSEQQRKELLQLEFELRIIAHFFDMA